MKTYELKTAYGDYQVNVVKSYYQNNDTLAILAYDSNTGDLVEVLTTNIHDSDTFANSKEAFVDTNNCPWAISFIEQNGLGKATGYYGYSGFCKYPLYQFNVDEIEDLEIYA